MKAFHNDPAVKELYLSRVRAHRMADELIKGTYWKGGKGCAVGCTVHSGDHRAYEKELGVPRILARLEDGIFEKLPNELAMTWPERFLDAIPIGADLSLVWPKFAVWLLIDPKYGVLQFAKQNASKKAIQDVADAYQKAAEGAELKLQPWADLRAAAAYAAASSASAAASAAAYAASASASASSAYAAASSASASAYAAAAAAADAADAAAYSAAADADADASADAYSAAAAASAKRTEWRIAQSEKLLELLAQAKEKA
jgi:hypothetical protein